MASPAFKFLADTTARRTKKLNESHSKNKKKLHQSKGIHKYKLLDESIPLQRLKGVAFSSETEFDEPLAPAASGPLNLIGKKEYSMTMDEGSRQLFLIMNDSKYEYCLYRFSEPEKGKDESAILKLEKPLQKMRRSTYPSCMSFVAVGASIFMVGGCYARKGNNPFRISNETFIYDTLSNAIKPGPTLVSPKDQPYLLTVGSKIYALSRYICHFKPYCDSCDPLPRFEVLDTNDLERGWSALSVPTLHISKKKVRYYVTACASAYVSGSPSGAIFISVEESGTYAYDVDKDAWKYVSDGKLPFSGCAVSMPPSPDVPCAPSLCCAFSDKFEGPEISAFRFHYYGDEADENDFLFQVDELAIDNSPLLSPPLPPEIYHESTLIVVDPIGRVYSVTSGIDRYGGLNWHDANRVVKVVVCKVESINGQLSDNCKMKEGEMDHGAEQDEAVELSSSKDQVLKRCTQRERQMGHDEELDETVELNSSKHALKICTKRKRQMGHDEEGDETVMRNLNGKSLKRCSKKKRHMGNDEGVEFKSTQLWRRTFFGGPMVDAYTHVCAAIAM